MTKQVTGVMTGDVHVRSFEPLMTPQEIRSEFVLPEKLGQQILQHRQEIHNCLRGKDKRLVVLVGPCSIHDVKSGLAYAKLLRDLQEKVKESFLLVMRVYFEKPRTTVGWKGLINDPYLDGSNNIRDGLKIARQFLLDVGQLGLPCGTEFLDPIIPQYISDLVSWVAIGARTTESQTHRELASGLSMPVGFKNATDGDLQIAFDALVSARSPHAFLGIDEKGFTSVVNTSGNPDVHVILRGGGGKTNYDEKSIAQTKQRLGTQETVRSIMIDCSHGNSNKDFNQQPQVFKNVASQYRAGNEAILGLMLESFLVAGKQSIGKQDLTYGQSITDGCISWETTATLLTEANDLLRNSK